MGAALGDELGYQVTGFEALKSGINDILDSRPDLLLLDLVLGNPAQMISGWELLVLCHSHRELRHVPIIVVSADTGGVLKQRADDLAKMANVHILTKPFDMKALEELVGRLLTP